MRGFSCKIYRRYILLRLKTKLEKSAIRREKRLEILGSLVQRRFYRREDSIVKYINDMKRLEILESLVERRFHRYEDSVVKYGGSVRFCKDIVLKDSTCFHFPIV